MAQLSVTAVLMAPATTTGVTFATVASSSNGDKYLNTGREVVMFQNTSSQAAAASVVTVTAQTPDNFGGAASLHNITITVPTSSQYGLTAIGPFPPSVFNDANGNVNLTYSVAGLNIGVFSIAPRS